MYMTVKDPDDEFLDKCTTLTQDFGNRLFKRIRDPNVVKIETDNFKNRLISSLDNLKLKIEENTHPEKVGARRKKDKTSKIYEYTLLLEDGFTIELDIQWVKNKEVSNIHYEHLYRGKPKGTTFYENTRNDFKERLTNR